MNGYWFNKGSAGGQGVTISPSSLNVVKMLWERANYPFEDGVKTTRIRIQAYVGSFTGASNADYWTEIASGVWMCEDSPTFLPVGGDIVSSWSGLVGNEPYLLSGEYEIRTSANGFAFGTYLTNARDGTKTYSYDYTPLCVAYAKKWFVTAGASGFDPLPYVSKPHAWTTRGGIISNGGGNDSDGYGIAKFNKHYQLTENTRASLTMPFAISNNITGGVQWEVPREESRESLIFGESTDEGTIGGSRYVDKAVTYNYLNSFLYDGNIISDAGTIYNCVAGFSDLPDVWELATWTSDLHYGNNSGAPTGSLYRTIRTVTTAYVVPLSLVLLNNGRSIFPDGTADPNWSNKY